MTICHKYNNLEHPTGGYTVIFHNYNSQQQLTRDSTAITHNYNNLEYPTGGAMAIRHNYNSQQQLT